MILFLAALFCAFQAGLAICVAAACYVHHADDRALTAAAISLAFMAVSAFCTAGHMKGQEK